MADSILKVSELLSEYSQDIQDAITKECEVVAKNGANTLKQKSPKRTGSYSKGWRVKTSKGNGYVSSIVYNATHPQLTHLLERGHDWIGRDGRKKENAAKPSIHIAPVEQECIKEYETNVEQIIKNGV